MPLSRVLGHLILYFSLRCLRVVAVLKLFLIEESYAFFFLHGQRGRYFNIKE